PLEENEKFCDKCGKSVTETSEEYYENYITEDNEIPVMSKLPSFFKEKKSIMIIGASVVAVALIFLSGNIIPDRNNAKTEVTNNNDETTDASVTEGSTAAVSDTTVTVEETAYAVTVAPPPEDYKEINYEELYNSYIRELANYYGVAAQNPFMQYPASDINDMRPVPSESFGLVSAYQSDINHDEVKDLVAISFINDDSNYIWRTQCFSVNENKEIYQVSRYDFKIEKKYTYFLNHFMKAEIVDGYLVYSCSYCHYEGRTNEVLIMKLSDLSLNKAGIINTYSHGGTSISVDGLKVNFNLNYQEISANDRFILSEDKVNNIALQKFHDLGINCTRVSMGGETDLALLFDTSYVLFDYSSSIGSKVYYPQEYTELYSLLGLTKEYKVLEPKALAKNTAPVTSSRSFKGFVDIDYGVLNLRYRPNTDSEILAEIPKDANLYLYPTSTEGWYYTYYENYWGYVSADYIGIDPAFTTTITTIKVTEETTTEATTSNTTEEVTTICETTTECVTEPPVTIPPVPDDTQPPAGQEQEVQSDTENDVIDDQQNSDQTQD
ncbi:MAG: SH3 domain-containing protein, partial [Oscillospiraceae bacterium]|nr:SH3 domain-containing protein [Oscillospiraceae bacterium]